MLNTWSPRAKQWECERDIGYWVCFLRVNSITCSGFQLLCKWNQLCQQTWHNSLVYWLQLDGVARRIHAEKRKKGASYKESKEGLYLIWLTTWLTTWLIKFQSMQLYYIYFALLHRIQQVAEMKQHSLRSWQSWHIMDSITSKVYNR